MSQTAFGKLSRLFIVVAGLLLAQSVWAETFTIRNNQSDNPPCSGGSWSRSGSLHICSGRVILQAGDIVVSNSSVTLRAENGFALNSNTIGSSADPIALVSNYGTIVATGSASSFSASITSGSGAIQLANATVAGTVTSTSGSIDLTGGSISGLVRSGCCNVTTNNTDLQAGARSDSSGLSITGGTIAGDFLANNNPAVFSSVTMTSGSVSGASTVTFTDSTVGDAQNSVNVTAVSGAVTLNNSTVFGNLTAPNYSTIMVNSPSTVVGTCVPNSTPADACSSTLVTNVLSWSLDETSWAGAANEVLDTSGNTLSGTVVNGANTASTAPALPTNNAQGTCGYGSFTSASSQYVQRAHSNLLTLQGSYTIGLWVKPRSLPSTGLMTLLSKDENYEFHLNPNGTVNWWWQTTGPAATREFNSTTALTVGQWSHVLVRYAPGDQRIYINGNLAGQASFSGIPEGNTDPVQLGADQGTAGRYFNGELDELRIYSGALSQTAISALVAERHQCALALQCFNDTFSAAALGDDWSVASRGSTAFTPTVSNGRMRLTSNQGNVSTSSTLQRLFPAAGNYIQVQFKHYAYNGSGADGIAVVLSDASVTPQPGSFGGPLGYGARSAGDPGFAGGWLGVGIDEFGNYSGEGGPGGPGRRLDSVAMRGSGSGGNGYNYIAGTPANLNPGIDNAASTSAAPGHTYRITMDGRFTNEARVTVERDSGAGFVVLPNLNAVNVLASAGQAGLPANFYLSLTGSTGGSTNIHELDDLQVCATTINPIGQQIHHFEFVYTNPALTCNPHPVTVRACRNADCSSLYTDPVSVTLTPSGVWNPVGSAVITNGNVLGFTGGAANVRLGRSVAEVVTVGASASTPPAAPNNQTICSTLNCRITYADSGFLIQVPNMIAAKAVNGIIRAVKSDDATQACVPGFANVTRSIGLTAGYNNPTLAVSTAAGATLNKPVVVNESNVTHTAISSLNLYFDGSGSAPITVRYDDAGLMTLNANYTGSSANGDVGLNMTGSGEFKSRPYGLCLQTGSTCTQAGVNGNCTVFARAGNEFPLRISAVGWQRDDEPLTAAELCAGNIVTPKFEMANIGLASALVEPQDGVPGAPSLLTYNHVLGAQTTVNLSLSEVGVFRLNATPPATLPDRYLSTEIVDGGSSALIGRIAPAYLGAVGSGSLTPSCGSAFSYQGQPMNFAALHEPTLTVTGYNRQGAVTRNYDRGNFWRLNTPMVGVYSSITNTAVDPRLTTSGTASVASQGENNGDGARTYRWSGQQLIYGVPTNSPSTADLPFMAKVRHTFSAAALTDNDGACHGTACSDFSYDFTNSPGSEVRLGRLRIGNAHGSELQALSLPLTIESWQTAGLGSSFLPEGLDNCTAAQLGPPVLADYGGRLAAGETAPSRSGPTAGVGFIGLTAPGAGNDGSVRASFSPTLSPIWLYYDWNGTGREMASGLATFGIYRGATPLIFRRELYR